MATAFPPKNSNSVKAKATSEDRSGTLSTIIVGQRPCNYWHDFIDNPVIADAILDRLSRDRHQIKLRGESLRRREASFDGL